MNPLGINSKLANIPNYKGPSAHQKGDKFGLQGQPDASDHDFDGGINEEVTVDQQGNERDSSGSATGGSSGGGQETGQDLGYGEAVFNQNIAAGLTKASPYKGTGKTGTNDKNEGDPDPDPNPPPPEPEPDPPPPEPDPPAEEPETGATETIQSNFITSLEDVVLDLDDILNNEAEDEVEEGGNSGTFFPVVISPEVFDPLLNQGMSSKKNEIVSLTEFKSVFIDGSAIGAEATPVIDFNEDMISSISNVENLIPTPAARLLELQVYVRRLCTKNVRDLISEFANSPELTIYNNTLKGLISKIMNANKKYNFLDNVGYNFQDNTFDQDQFLFNLRNKDTKLAIELSAGLRNPYVYTAVRYIVLNSFALKLIELLASRIGTRDKFLNDFYTEIILGADISNPNVKLAFNDRQLTMKDHDEFMASIVKTSAPNSVNVVRIVKALHAACSGLILNSGDVFNDSEGQESNMRLGVQQVSFLHGQSMISHFGLMTLFDPSCELDPNMQGDGLDENISDQLDEMSAMITSFENIKRCLIPLIYDLKNIEGFSNEKNAQYKLIKSHLHPGSDSLDDITNSNLGLQDDDLNLQVDLLKYFDNSFDVDFTPNAADSDSIFNTPLGKIIYGESEDSEGNTTVVLNVDSNGIAHEDVQTSNVVFAKDAYFKFTDYTGESLQNTADEIKTSCNKIISDIADNYGLKGLTENAEIPQSYMEGYFDSLATKLEDLKNTTTTSTTRLTEAIMFSRSGENKRFCSRMFVATQGLFHRDEHGQVEIGFDNEDGERVTFFDNFRFNEKLEDPGDGTAKNLLQGIGGALAGGASGFGGAFLLALAFGGSLVMTGGVIAIIVGAAAVVGTLSVLIGDESEYYPSAKHKLFALFYNSIVPGTQLTLGDNDAEDKLDQIFMDAAYKNRRVGKKKEYDGGSIEHFWNKNKDASSKKTIGNDEYENFSLPRNATDSVFLRRAGNFNKIFTDVFANSKSRANRGLVCLPFAYEREFVNSRSQLSSKLVDDETKDRISRNCIYSTSLSRSLVLHNLTAHIFRISTSFTLSLSKLDGNDTNDNNKEREIKAHYNTSMFSGMIDGLRGNSQDTSLYSNTADPMYKNAYDKCKFIRDSILGDISDLDDKALILTAAISKIAGYYSKKKEDFVNSTDNNSGEAVFSYLASADPKMLNFYNKEQFKLTSVLQKKLLTPSKFNFYLPSSKDLTQSRLNCMYKYFSNTDRNFVSSQSLSSLSKDKKIIMHIGITNGLVERLRQSQLSDLGVETLDLDEKTKAMQTLYDSTIIHINIYKTVLMNPGSDSGVLVKTVKFDMAKFFIDNVDDGTINDSHNQLASNNVKVRDFIMGHRLYHVFDDMSLVPMRGSDLNLTEDTENPDLQLTSDERKEIFVNHLDDHYLKLYCQAMLGLDMDEDIYHFAQNKQSALKLTADDVEQFDSIFVTPINNAIPPRLASTAYNQERNRLKSEAAKSIFFSPKKYLDRVIQPKLFDRVFSIMIEKTSESSVIFNQYYCTITLSNKIFKPKIIETVNGSGRINHKPNKGDGLVSTDAPIKPKALGSKGSNRR